MAFWHWVCCVLFCCCTFTQDFLSQPPYPNTPYESLAFSVCLLLLCDFFALALVLRSHHHCCAVVIGLSYMLGGVVSRPAVAVAAVVVGAATELFAVYAAAGCHQCTSCSSARGAVQLSFAPCYLCAVALPLSLCRLCAYSLNAALLSSLLCRHTCWASELLHASWPGCAV